MYKIKKESEYVFTMDKSKFLGFSFYVDSEELAKEHIDEISKKYNDARHICYAYKIEPNIEKKENSSEPQGTAGTPILNAITKNDYTNVLIIVVRYFGGILLGTGGLFRAYGTTASETLSLSGKNEIRKYQKFRCNLHYSEYNRLINISQKNENIVVLNAEFGQSIMVDVACKDMQDCTFLEEYIIPNSTEELWL